MTTNRLCNKSFLLHLHGGPIQDWMDIMTISIPLDDVCWISSDGNVEAIEKWRECIMLPRILLTLEDFCMIEDVDGFKAFLAACNALPDPSLAIAFMPIDDSRVSLSPVDIHQCISAVCMLGSDVPIMVQCSLGVQFVGVVGCELKKLL